jgi:hypothetical protein
MSGLAIQSAFVLRIKLYDTNHECSPYFQTILLELRKFGQYGHEWHGYVGDGRDGPER